MYGFNRKVCSCLWVLASSPLLSTRFVVVLVGSILEQARGAWEWGYELAHWPSLVPRLSPPSPRQKIKRRGRPWGQGYLGVRSSYFNWLTGPSWNWPLTFWSLFNSWVCTWPLLDLWPLLLQMWKMWLTLIFLQHQKLTFTEWDGMCSSLLCGNWVVS